MSVETKIRLSVECLSKTHFKLVSFSLNLELGQELLFRQGQCRAGARAGQEQGPDRQGKVNVFLFYFSLSRLPVRNTKPDS